MTILDRPPQPQQPTDISKREKCITIQIVANLDDRQKAMAIRAAVFLGKPGWTYDHTFDPNDQCATHILGSVDGEPAGTVRVRWFKDFARIERIAILEEYRSLSLLNGLARAATRLCRKKGYDQVGGLAYPELAKFWSRHGGKPCGAVMESEYGSVIPILLTPREFPDLEPLNIAEAGTREFEWKAFEWEGDGVA